MQSLFGFFYENTEVFNVFVEFLLWREWTDALLFIDSLGRNWNNAPSQPRKVCIFRDHFSIFVIFLLSHQTAFAILLVDRQFLSTALFLILISARFCCFGVIVHEQTVIRRFLLDWGVQIGHNRVDFDADHFVFVYHSHPCLATSTMLVVFMHFIIIDDSLLFLIPKNSILFKLIHSHTLFEVFFGVITRFVPAIVTDFALKIATALFVICSELFAHRFVGPLFLSNAG